MPRVLRVDALTVYKAGPHGIQTHKGLCLKKPTTTSQKLTRPRIRNNRKNVRLQLRTFFQYSLDVEDSRVSSAHSDHMLIPPRILPRDFVDCCVGVVVGIFGALVLFGIPAAAAFLITRSETIAFITFCAAYGIFFCFSVRRLSVSPSGIRFHRLFGTPAFLPWGRISSIAVAPR